MTDESKRINEFEDAPIPETQAEIFQETYEVALQLAGVTLGCGLKYDREDLKDVGRASNQRLKRLSDAFNTVARHEQFTSRVEVPMAEFLEDPARAFETAANTELVLVNADGSQRMVIARKLAPLEPVSDKPKEK
jgi:hypothetical protein